MSQFASIRDERWVHTDHEGRIHDVVVDGDALYTACKDGYVRKIDAETGETVWRYSDHWTAERWEGSRRISEQDYPVQAVATDDDGNVYIGARTEEVRKISPDGETVWRYTGHVLEETPPQERTPRIDNRVLALDVQGNAVFSLARANEMHKLPLEPTNYTDDDVPTATVTEDDVPTFASPLWTYEDDSTIRDVTVVPDGEAYIGTVDGILRRIGVESGRERWSFEAFDPHSDGLEIVTRDANDRIVAYNATVDNEVQNVDPHSEHRSGDENSRWKFYPETELTIPDIIDVDVDTTGDVYLFLRPAHQHAEPGKLLRVDHDRTPSDGTSFHRAETYETDLGGTALAVTDEYLYYAEHELSSGLFQSYEPVANLVSLPKSAF
ncbi:hypothetical protein D8S78_01490 [Natrialba swarupiae]|nr:hypothetical protein [Natrialba swarupiae]